ncbi:peptidoglycan DD-metalloendopeptidase family protein [Nocardioides mangrovi]|uniref:Peptidoglycan DD-metalloendopeptidase family protein n=1 Tax=Nocardioides mangrovi TaxID=2874580 RepID=A0ABS7U923_9ACTN|nr:peptidoglycan DD-metalloendopeptidase family protein [Nocardioides mangrovi]MBZ5737479.1 peptidoglycan DD-metalloendopeptidase family protein [Nocardioides mangrovi]
MRLFPRTASPRLLAATTVCALAVGAVAIPLASADPHQLKDRQQHAQSKIHHAQRDLDESSSRLRKAQAALDSAQKQLDGARAAYQSASTRLDAAKVRDRDMQEKLAAAESKLATAEQDLADGQAALEEQRQTVTDTITDIYEQGDPDLIAFGALLNSRSTADLTRREEAHSVIVGKQTAAYDDLHAAEVLLQVRERQVQDARDEVEVQRQAAADHLVTMQALHQETREARDRVRDLVQDRRAAQSDARDARQKDLRALHRAKQREQRIRQKILAQARRARGGYTGPTNGLFIRPVPGVVTSPFGWRIHPIYHYWGLHDGTDFGVSCGEPMKAIAGGTVIEKYWSDVYGNRLYVSLGQINGKNVTAVYNHATSYRVNVGDHVTQGETVGYVGSTGWSTGCHLHFTILVNGTAVDPMNWLP